MEREEFFIQEALKSAQEAYQNGEVPVGAVIVSGDQIIARGANAVIRLNDPTAHAEIIALREAGRVLNNYRLTETELFVTLEPCTMCFAALVHARIKSLCYAAPDAKTGVVSTGVLDQIKKIFNHTITINEKSGIIGATSTKLLQTFFKERRGAGVVERDGLESR